MSNDEKRGNVVPIGGVASEWLEEALGERASWTAEEWARHDAAVAARREAELGPKQVEERRLAAAARRRELVEQGVPLKVLDEVLAGESRDTEAMRLVRSMLSPGAFARPVRILVLSGPRGVGKTFAAAWWVAQAHTAPPVLDAQPPRFIDAPSLSRWPRYDDAKMRVLELARALVLDDLGLDYDDKAGAQVSLVDGLVNARYGATLPTVITTNMQADAFKARYGERVADRIREVGRFMSLTGESLRQRKEGDRA